MSVKVLEGFRFASGLEGNLRCAIKSTWWRCTSTALGGKAVKSSAVTRVVAGPCANLA